MHGATPEIPEALPLAPRVPHDFAFLVGTEGIGLPSGARRALRALEAAIDNQSETIID